MCIRDRSLHSGRKKPDRAGTAYFLSSLRLRIGKKEAVKTVRGEAENAGGLTPAKDGNEAHALF